LLPRRKAQAHAHSDAAVSQEGKPLLEVNGNATIDVEASSGGDGGGNGGGGAAPTSPLGEPASGKPSYAWTSSAMYRCLMLDPEALLSSREALRAAVEFGTILAWFYVADRTSIIAPGPKVLGASHSDLLLL
jgi:hypothetical protein